MNDFLIRNFFVITILLSTNYCVYSADDGLGGLAKDIVPRLSERNEDLQETIRLVVLQLRNESAIQVPGVEIEDPMFIPDFNTTVSQTMTTADVKMWNVSISGMSKVILDEVDVNLAQMNIGIGLNITELMIRGQYNLTGKVSFFRLSGAGDFYMSVQDAYVTGNLILGVNDEGILEVTDVDMDITVDEIELKFDKLFGGGIMSRFSNTLLNALSPIIFNSVKPTLLNEMQTIMKTMLNERFHQLPAQPTLVKSQVPLDLVIANAATQIRQNGLDPFPLPGQQLYFNRRLLFIRFYGNVTLHGGYLRGLSSIHRTGDIRLTYKDNYGNATAQIGFENLEGGYKWYAHFMGLSRRGGAHFAVKQIHASVTFTQVNQKDSHPVVDQLTISHIDQLGVDIDGMGSFDFLLEFFTNFFTNAFKKQFARILETQMKQVLQENLKEFKIPF